MSLIDREATFRGNVIDHGASESTNHWPQWVAKFDAFEIWDEESQEWVDWSQYEETEIIGYFVLNGKSGETLTCRQVAKATGWDGISYFELSEMDLSTIAVQFRVESRTYQEKTRLEVTWIDEQDAVPGKTVRKATPEELKALDTRFKKLMKKTTPASAPAKPKAGRPKAPPKVTKTGVEPTQPQGPVTKKTKPPSPKSAELPKSAIPEGKCTRQEAYETCYELKKPTVTDEKLNEAWFAAILSVTGSNNQDQVTEEQWFHIKDCVLDKVAKF